jgi:hypothetical protein
MSFASFADISLRSTFIGSRSIRFGTLHPRTVIRRNEPSTATVAIARAGRVSNPAASSDAASTFSTFGLDTITLFRTRDVMQAFSSVLIQVVGGLVGVYGELVLFERLGSTVH